MSDNKFRIPKLERKSAFPTPRARDARASSSGATAVRRKKILLVDDSATALMLETMILSVLPCDVVTASDGEQAVDAVERERPDLVLMDMVMPRMDGLEACRRIRQTRAGSALPVILVTTRGEPSHVRAAYEHGCTDYVAKPVDHAELLAKVRAYLET